MPNINFQPLHTQPHKCKGTLTLKYKPSHTNTHWEGELWYLQGQYFLGSFLQTQQAEIQPVLWDKVQTAQAYDVAAS